MVIEDFINVNRDVFMILSLKILSKCARLEILSTAHSSKHHNRSRILRDAWREHRFLCLRPAAELEVALTFMEEALRAIKYERDLHFESERVHLEHQLEEMRVRKSRLMERALGVALFLPVGLNQPLSEDDDPSTCHGLNADDCMTDRGESFLDVDLDSNFLVP